MDRESNFEAESRPQKQVDLSRLFSDVSRTVSGIKSILGGSPTKHLGEHSQSLVSSDMGNGASQIDDAASSSTKADESSSPFGGLFGGSNVCFKTCGMEDIQFAARRAGEMFLTIKVCVIILTVITVICALAFTIAILIHLHQKRRLAQESLVYSADNYDTSSNIHKMDHQTNNNYTRSNEKTSK